MEYGRRAAACALAGVLGVVLMLAAGATSRSGAATTCPASSPGPGTTRILAAGDSLTQGSLGDWTWRYRVWQHLRAAGVDATFVGPFDFLFDNLTGNPFGTTEYADPCFDRQHYAIAGSTYQDLLAPPTFDSSASSGISWTVNAYDADVVVQFAGLNDLLEGATVDEVLSRAKKFLDEVRAANPHASVIIPTLPTTQMPDTVPEYNDRLAALVPTWSTDESHVVLADSMRDWAGTQDTWDGWHPYRVLVRRAGGRWATLTWSSGTRILTPRLAARQRYAFKVQAWQDLVPGGISSAARVLVR